MRGTRQRPPARFSVVVVYGPWGTVAIKASLKTPLRGVQTRSMRGDFVSIRRRISSRHRQGKFGPRRAWLTAKIRVTFCERLRRNAYKTREKNAFGPEKTRFKKSLIILFVAKVNGHSMFYYFFRNSSSPHQVNASGRITSQKQCVRADNSFERSVWYNRRIIEEEVLNCHDLGDINSEAPRLIRS